jgi:hypothetical protein
MIEIGRYKNLETEERLCKLCITQKIEDEYHFLIHCPIYNSSRKICYQKISELCSNFNNMSDKSKFYYLLPSSSKNDLRIENKNKNKKIYYSNQWAHNRGKQMAYIDYCHWKQLYIYIYK